jgi:hypothetical protein
MHMYVHGISQKKVFEHVSNGCTKMPNTCVNVC